MTDPTPVTSTIPAQPVLLAKFGGRKFIIAMLVVVMAFAYRALGYFDSAITLQMVSLAVGMFSAANVVQKLLAKVGG